MRNTKIKEMAKDLEGYSIDTAIDCEHVAEVLYNAGYRKASNVARKIFEEIENAIGYDFYSGEELRIVFALSKLDEVKRKHLNENFFVKMTHTCPHNIPDLVTSISD